MEKVYIVTSGEYSDYTIEAVFSTREKAEEYVSVLKLNDPVEIVEWNVDGIIKGDEAKHYEATFAYETGELLLTEEVYMNIHLRPMIQAMPDNGGNFNIKIQFSTVKTDAVRKIASEIFMQVKALQPVKDRIAEKDPVMARFMVRNCIYRGFCPERECCGFVNTEQFRKELEEYRGEYSKR